MIFNAAICNPQCENGGTCVQPGVCVCESGWTGERCGQGLSYFDCSVQVPYYTCSQTLKS